MTKKFVFFTKFLLIFGLVLFCMVVFPIKRNISQTLYFDFNLDGVDETVQLKNGQVFVYSNSDKVFESDADWDAEEILIGDFNNNGTVDLGVYLWKVGNYGEAKPFWVDENDTSYKQHLFLYEWEGNGFKALWHSSNLPFNNVQTELKDVNNDFENELVVIERPYEWGHGKKGQSKAIWKWDEWGFVLLERNYLE